MSEPVEDSTIAESGSRSIATRVLAWTVGSLLSALVAVVLVRVFLRPIPPEQAVPEGHFGEPCVLCHIVTDSADEVELP